jgi:hypothetical protein
MQELVSHEQFFAPMASDFIDGLIASYRSERKTIETLSDFMANADMLGALNYFFKGNKDCFTHSTSYVTEKMFKAVGAISALNATYWHRTLKLTDVYDYMPQARRDEWNKSIEKMQTPDFEDETVRSTLDNLLSMRSKFLAERVDGIFRNLSGNHVTNQPQGFRKRMILEGVTDKFSYSSGSRCGYINDLRAVIAKFMGRDEPKHNATNDVVKVARRNSGQWMTVDGGAMRIRVYIKGTAHLEIHPDMAWRLNMILASLYPMAIPAEFRTKPQKKTKEYSLFSRPLPFAVLACLGSLDYAHESIGAGKYKRIPNTLTSRYWGNDAAAIKEAWRVLEMLGGVKIRDYMQFDYDPQSVIDEIVCSGCIPDKVSHQFYPTPERLAKLAVAFADIGINDTVIEPSAGMGSIVDEVLYKQNVTCVEVSYLHCKVLESKGYPCVICDDFLKLPIAKYDRVLMNPPFSDGRWQAHVEHAAKFLVKGGRLVALLPASAKGKDLKGFDCEWRGPYDNEFSGTSVSVIILVADSL